MERLRQIPPPEILHTFKCDVVVNKSQTSVSAWELDELAQELTSLSCGGYDNIKGGWPFLPSGVRCNSTENPKYVMKEKWLRLGSSSLAMAIQEKRVGVDRNNGRKNLKKEMYANNSVLNEISLSPEIKAVVATKRVQKMARLCGYGTFEFVEPLVAIIDNTHGVKSVVYKYVKEDRGATEMGFQYFVNELKLVFSQFNIETPDLLTRQFLVRRDEGEKSLFLIDAESYYKKTINY